MLLKEQKAKFSFLASDEDDEEDRKEDKKRASRLDGGEQRGVSGDGTEEHKSDKQVGDNGEKDHRRKGDRDGHRGRKRGKGAAAGRSPTVLSANTPSSSTYSPHIPPSEGPQPQVAPAGTEGASQLETADTVSRTGARTPPYNGQSRVRAAA